MKSSIVERHSVCPLDCPDTCSLKVSVDGERIVKIRGSHVNPFTSGSICSKVAKFYPDFVHGSKRLQQPMLRSGAKGSGQFTPISWQQAIEHIYQQTQAKIDCYGPQTVLPLNYAGPHGKLAGGAMDQRFFERLGASDLYRSALCGGVKGLAYRSMFGTSPGMPPEQAEEADLILIWGTNTSVTNVHLMRVINRARKRGAKLVVIDPRETQVARQADLFIQISPASDVVLALKLTAKLAALGKVNRDQLVDKVHGLEEYIQHAQSFLDHDLATLCGVATEAFEQLMKWVGDAKTIALSVGVGLERSCNGGSAIRAACAIPVLFGNLGRRGQGVMTSYSAVFKSAAKAHLATGPQKRRVFNILDSADKLLDDKMETPISVAFIYNHNPVATHPDQNKMRKALSQERLFVVGCDVQMNDSMLYADVLLPACTHFEHHDVFTSYGHGYLQRAEPVITAVAQSLPNTEIFRRLAARFGFEDSCFKDSDSQLIDQQFDLADQGIERVSQLPINSALAMQNIESVWLDLPTLNTPSGLIELLSDQLAQSDDSALPSFTPPDQLLPFRLLTPASDRRINATFGASSAQQVECLEINPLDAKRLGLQDMEEVIIENGLGKVQLIAKLSNAIAPGVLCCEKGAWCSASVTGQSANALISSASRTDIGEGAAYYDTFVELYSARK